MIPSRSSRPAWLRAFACLLAAAFLAGPAHAARRALVVGISEYTDPDIPDLRYAADDARAIAAYLREKAAFDDVTLLVDGQATRAAVQTALAQSLPRQSAPDDVVVVFYSGHGATELDVSGEEPDGLRKFLVPVDADPQNLLVTAIDMRDVSRWLDWISAGTVVSLIDSCYSGGAAGGRGLRGHAGVRALGRVPAPAAPGRVTITASQANQVSLELDALGHGLFTWALLEGLGGAADASGDGQVTLTELYAWLQPEVAKVAARMGGRQEPRFDGTLSTEISLGGRASGPDPDAERRRLAAIEAGVREREALLRERRTLAAEALRVSQEADASDAVSAAEKIALWEKFLDAWRGEAGTDVAEARLAWWRSANRTFLDVDADHAGAEIWLDGEPRGTAPKTLVDVPIGRHHVVVGRASYHPWESDVTVPAGGLRVRAALKPAFGSVSVASDPPGATVYIGDVNVGTTPLTLQEVRSGPLRVTLRLDRYAPKEAFVEVQDGVLALVDEDLPPRFGRVVLDGAPDGATVTIGGKRPAPAPSGGYEVDAGTAEVKVEKPGRKGWSGRVNVVAGQAVTVAVPPLDVLTGTLTVVSEPRGATVLLDGKDVGVAPLTLPDVPAGPHALELRAGGQRWSGNVDVAVGQVTTHTATLATARPGMIHVDAGVFRAGTAATPTSLGAFFIDRTEVSNRQYHQCVAAGACREPHARSELQRSDLPAVGVTWRDADAYCRWVGARLPTGLEWERAARGTDGRVYPWGNAWDDHAANWNDGGKVDGFVLTASVDAFADHAAPSGALNMAGNALEWTSEAMGDRRAVRGGSALMEGGPEGLKVTARFAVPPDAASEGIGFRCAADE